MFCKIKDVKPLEDYKLLVTFENGINKYYDVKPLFNIWPMFRILEKDDELFLNVKVDNGGCGISWNDDIDLSCDELWENGKENIA